MPFAHGGASRRGPRGGGRRGGGARKEEARQRAEAEQAALEQLKEENPDAYAKPPEPPEAGGEDSVEGAEQSRPAEDATDERTPEGAKES
jgi:hypothetical protein